MIETKEYNLPDYKVFNSKQIVDFISWVPDKRYLVIGKSNKAIDSVIEQEVVKDGIDVYQRPSGGEAVLLSEKTLVIAFKFEIKNVLKTHQYFEKINNKVIRALENQNVKNLHQKGISDVSIKDKKILGSSIYRKENKVFYHAVINISEDVDVIQKYLKHPKKEPDYRKGRDHKSFVTSIKDEGFTVDVEKFRKDLDELFLV